MRNLLEFFGLKEEFKGVSLAEMHQTFARKFQSALGAQLKAPFVLNATVYHTEPGAIMHFRVEDETVRRPLDKLVILDASKALSENIFPALIRGGDNSNSPKSAKALREFFDEVANPEAMLNISLVAGDSIVMAKLSDDPVLWVQKMLDRDIHNINRVLDLK